MRALSFSLGSGFLDEGLRCGLHGGPAGVVLDVALLVVFGSGRVLAAVAAGRPVSVGLGLVRLRRGGARRERERRGVDVRAQPLLLDDRHDAAVGERSERIRTYNFPQGRVTDHRIGLTLYKIGAVMDGALDELVDALATAERAEQLRMSEQQ